MKRYAILPVLVIAAMAALISCSSGAGSAGDDPANQDPGTVKPINDAAVTIAAIPDVVVPVRGAAPVTASIETAQYVGTVSWEPADNPFAALTAYTATVSLTAKPGFTLAGVAANFFTVAGATATNDAGSNVVKAVFPATGRIPDVNVSFLGTCQEGGISYTADTTAVTLRFDVDPTTLSADNVTVTGATKGTLSGTGLTRTLAIADIAVANGGTVSVTVTSPAGYAVSGSPRAATVYREIAIGRQYLGGAIGYILRSGDAGYDAAVPHGLILCNEDLDTYCRWSIPPNLDTMVGGTSMAIGTGRTNTDLIVAQNGPGNYAAYLTRVYAGGGFTDWYLPSARELEAIRRNIYLIPSCYRSSSECDASNAYVVWNDYAVLGEGKYGGRYVRAVRSF